MESDFGLGIVVVFDVCIVILMFVVLEENCVYVCLDVLVICVIFNVGDVVDS